MGDSKVVKAGIGYTVGNYLLKGFSFITVPIFARLLTTDDFGIYSTFVAYETILFIVLGCAIHTSYKNAKYKFSEEDNLAVGLSYNGYVSSTILLLVLNFLLFLLIANVFSSQLTSTLKLSTGNLNLLVLYSFSTAVLTCFNSDASLSYNYKSYLLVSGLNAVGNLLISVVLILTVYSAQRYMGRILGTVVPMFIISLILCIKLLGRQKPSNVGTYLRWGLSFSIPIVFHGISQVILSQFDRIMIRDINGDTAAGIYSFGYTIFSIINVTFNSLDAVWTTWFYDKMNKNENKVIRKYSTLYILTILCLCVIVMLICPELVIVLGSHKYMEAKYCTIPIVASGFFVFLYTLPASIEYYHEKTKSIAFATLLAAALNIGLNYVFILKYGYVAAAYTTLFTYILYFLFHYYLARKIQGGFVVSNKTILFSSIFLMVIMILSLLIIDRFVERWLIALVIAITFIIFEERQIGMGKKLAQSVISRRT